MVDRKTKIEERIKFLETEIVMSSYSDGWTVNGLKLELENLKIELENLKK